MTSVHKTLKRVLEWLIYDTANMLLRLYELFQDYFEIHSFDLKSAIKMRILVALFAAQVISPLLFLSSLSERLIANTACVLVVLCIEMMLLKKSQKPRFSSWLIGIGAVLFNVVSTCFITGSINKLAGVSFAPIIGAIFISENQLSLVPVGFLMLLGILYRQAIDLHAADSQHILAALTSELLTNSLASCIFYALTLVESGKEMIRLHSKNEELAQLGIKLRELSTSTEGYAKRLTSTAEELKQSNRSLKEALETKRIFFTKISDELRNPINSIVGNLELLEEENLDPAIQEKISSVKWSTDLLLQMTNNLIDFAKLASGKIEINKKRTSVPQMLERLWAMSFYKLTQKGLRGFLNLAKDVPKYLSLDEEKVIEVCHNLITNSVKYTTRGQIKVFVTWHPFDDECHSHREPAPDDSLQKFSETTHATVFTKDHFEKLKIEPKVTENEASPVRSKSMGEAQSFTQLFAPQGPGSSLESETFSPHVGINLLKEFSFTLKNEKLLLDNYRSRFPSYLVPKNSGAHSTAKASRGMLKIEIIDTGSGIDPNLLSLLGKSLFSRDIEIARKIGGKGLGLYLACELTKLMDGEVLYFSKMNFGTSIIVKIPCESVEEPENTINIRRGATVSTIIKPHSYAEIESPKMALIVDDEKINRQILESFFKRFNIRCIQAENGKQAVEIFKSKPPGYFLFATVDIQMPVMDGKECCAQIRAFEEEENRECILPIVIVTGNCFEQDKQEIMDPSSSCRANYFYRKPLKMSDCENLVRDITGKNVTYSKSESFIGTRNES